MTIYLQVPLNEEIYEQVKRLAEAEQKEIEQLISEHLTSLFVSSRQSHHNEPDAETQAFLALHPMLKEKYLGQYVAIYRGQLIDHDKDNSALFERIDDQYPDEFVLMRKVEEESDRILHFRSPRFVPET